MAATFPNEMKNGSKQRLDPAILERQLPYPQEAEQGVLGSMLLSATVIDDVQDILREEMFYDEAHEALYKTIIELRDDGAHVIDTTLLIAKLKKKERFEKVGGTAYIGKIINAVPHAAHAIYYAEIVKRAWLKRRVIEISTDLIRDGYEETTEPLETIATADSKLAGLMEVGTGVKGKDLSAHELLAQALSVIDARRKGEVLAGLKSGFRPFDDKIGGFRPGELLILGGRPSQGKAQPLDSQVLMENGDWLPMGELAVGDRLASVDGMPSRVASIHPQGELEIFRVTFSDGRSVECCGEHLWKIRYRKGGKTRRGKKRPNDVERVRSTRQIIEYLKATRQQTRICVPLVNGDFGTRRSLPIDPWLLGIVLRDGNISQQGVRFCTADAEIAELARTKVGELSVIDYAKNQTRTPSYSIAAVRGKKNHVIAAFKELGLHGCRSWEKFIPPMYLSASNQQRWDLLRGLMDSDGTVELCGALTYSTGSQRLATDIIALGRSLGGVCKIGTKKPWYTYKGERREGRLSYKISLKFPDSSLAVGLARKQARVKQRQRTARLTIKSIEPIGRKPAQCIAVSHPSRLYVTDGYAVTHNTALALKLAADCATKEQGKVLLVSMEMAATELAERMISMASRVNGFRIRNGHLSAADMELLQEKSAELAHSHLWTIDEPGATVARIAAAVRRRKKDTGLDLVVIDYLQLIGVGKDDLQHNRQEQVASISRQLKLMARRMDVCVLCLAQLNRQNETANRVPRMSDLRECLVGSTLLTDADTGRMVRLDQVQSGMRTLGMNGQQKVESAQVGAVWSTGRKPVFKVSTESGRTIRGTANHPLRTATGWTRIEELQVGEPIAVAFRTEVSGLTGREALCRLLGYMAGNGSVQKHRTLGLILPDAQAFQDASEIITANWPTVSINLRANGYNDAWLSSVDENGYGRPGGNAMLNWLKEIGFHGLRDRNKRIPAFVFEAGVSGAEEFLAGYLASDGCVKERAACFDTTSRGLAEDVLILLARIGVFASISKGYVSQKATRPSYRISVSNDAANLIRFACRVHCRGVRGVKLAALAERCAMKKTRHSSFSLPAVVSQVAAGVSAWRHQGKQMSRRRAAEIAELTGDDELRKWADSDVVWDTVEAIEPDGTEETFDLSVPGLNCFLANEGIVSHNSGAIEQDADAVMFVHRPAYYDKKLTEANPDGAETALFIVDKQRNGPTGDTEVLFDKHCALYLPAAGQEWEQAAEEHFGTSGQQPAPHQASGQVPLPMGENF